MGVGFCGCPSYVKFSQIVHTYFTFMNSAPNSDFAADETKTFNMVQRVNISLLIVMYSPTLGTEPRKKWPGARLL